MRTCGTHVAMKGKTRRAHTSKREGVNDRPQPPTSQAQHPRAALSRPTPSTPLPAIRPPVRRVLGTDPAALYLRTCWASQPHLLPDDGPPV